MPTEILSPGGETREAGSPCLFVYCDHLIQQFELCGRQMIGRAESSVSPDIPISNKYVSRCHGYFETRDGRVRFLAVDTTNGIKYHNSFLSEGDSVTLNDGDELVIPAKGSGAADGGILLKYVTDPGMVGIWRELMSEATDSLTGLPTRSSFHAMMRQKLSQKGEEPVCLFILDIDFFKSINDNHGHEGGDHALTALARALSEAAENRGFVTRWGGDEFVGVIDGNMEGALSILSEMSGKLSRTRIDGKFNITLSIGVLEIGAVSPSQDIDSLISIADSALYQAKADGKNCIRHIYL